MCVSPHDFCFWQVNCSTTIQTSMLYQVVYNSKSYFQCVYVYIIVLCPENCSNDTVTGPNWNLGTDKKNTYRTPARIPVFEWVLYQEHTFTDKRQNTLNRRQIRFLPLQNSGAESDKRANRERPSRSRVPRWSAFDLAVVIFSRFPWQNIILSYSRTVWRSTSTR